MNTDIPPERRTVALIAGPTASGKSALALALAERLPAVIVNADSAQVYADLAVLSARPDAAETARAPHRLFGHVDGAEACSAARWAAEARAAITEAWDAGRVPILVGGTGLYLHTLIDGIAPVPEIDPAVRRAVRALPVAEAHRALAAEDPAAAARLAPADTSRVARALEVVRSTGRTLAEWQGERVGGIGHAIRLAATVLLPPRPWLFARCDARFEAMMAGGAVEEVERLRARGLDPALPVMRAIGVREIGGWLDGESDRAGAIAAAQAATRRYAKRQYTWFHHQPPAEWRRVTQGDSDLIGEIERILPS
ncbi:tRNA (adenosine(37)-N6)-dimethylallyltransferase MiaA [Sphingomonas flavalba]|uniref:tRNA (adenosine(37)-N6)-dimethylallyltransferase MiaA n=1 Tax=Sphingomonas flavalba TaxID=2559804 RepID=UPI0039E1D511